MKNKWRDWSTNSNHLHSDLNLKSELMKYKAKRFEFLSYGFESLHKLKQKAESRTERFESSSYGFESLLGKKFKYCKGDSNHLNSDSNHLLYKSIYYFTCSCNNSTFNSNLSHNDRWSSPTVMNDRLGIYASKKQQHSKSENSSRPFSLSLRTFKWQNS